MKISWTSLRWLLTTGCSTHVFLPVTGVAGCWWEQEQRQCRVANGYQLTSNQSQVIKITILEVTKETAGNYSCWHPASPPVHQETCILHVREKGKWKMLLYGFFSVIDFQICLLYYHILQPKNAHCYIFYDLILI